MKKCRNARSLIAVTLFLFPTLGYAQPAISSPTPTLGQDTADITEFTLEELMNLEVTSVSKKAQKLSEAAAAIFVITQEDIRRSGVTSIPEALRMVPGLQVAHIDANKWAITSRGFNGRLANKLLVLLDGRSVYTPLYSGVFWDSPDILMEDLARIEVIRGPGATLWGANAVNGVINIITKQARDTQGGLVTGGIGTEERGFGGVRYGSKLGDNAYCRMYTKYFKRDAAVYASGNDASDDWDAVQGGFRVDWQASERNAMTLQGDVYDHDLGQRGNYVTTAPPMPPYSSTFDETLESEGGNAILRWTRTFSESSEMMVQMYYDKFRRREFLGSIDVDTYDMDFQHRFGLGRNQEIIWGLGLRHTRDQLIDKPGYLLFDPHNRSYDLFSAFIQDNITLVQDRLSLSIGSKFEENDYTGSEIQPSGRILWTPEENHSVWVAVSRAVRTPSRAEHDALATLKVFDPSDPENLFSPLYAIYSYQGDEGFDSEDLLAWELGYRVHPLEALYLDFAAFFNDYNNLRSNELQSVDMTNPPKALVVLGVDNKMDGETYGIELAANWRPLEWWEFKAAYTYLQIQLQQEGDDQTQAVLQEGEGPRNQVSLRSSLDLSTDLEFDLWGRYVDKLPSQSVNSYVTLDTRIGWRPQKNLELSIVGQNLLESQHPEYVSTLWDTFPTEVERSVYGKIMWQF